MAQKSGTQYVPLIVTMDLEIAYDHDRQQQHEALLKIRRDCKNTGIKLTIFCTADAGDEFAEELKDLSDDGHEIGCHGLNHEPSENYQLLPVSTVRRIIPEATLRLYQSIGIRPRCFRGPSMTTSSVTQNALVECDYVADFSVCSQRLDIFHSRGGSIGWLFAPRIPYNPANDSPYRRGQSSLRVVPLSSIILPFCSGVLYLMGSRFMKAFYRVLLWEARIRGGCIVYLFHSYEFAERTGKQDKGWSKSKYLSAPSVWLHRLYLQNREKRHQQHLDLLRYMSACDDIVATTGSRLVEELKGQNPS